jgi:hypothetical protein
MLLSNNANTGGTCFGDSGGSELHRPSSVIVGVTRTASTTPAPGTGGVSRADRSYNLDWLCGTFGRNLR